MFSTDLRFNSYERMIFNIHDIITLDIYSAPLVYSLTLSLQEGYCKWFGKMSVCGPAVPQELDTPGLPYFACIHSSDMTRASTH